MKFSIKNLFRKHDQISRKLRIWSHLLKKSLMETNFIFCAVIFPKLRDDQLRQRTFQDQLESSLSLQIKTESSNVKVLEELKHLHKLGAEVAVTRNANSLCSFQSLDCNINKEDLDACN